MTCGATVCLTSAGNGFNLRLFVFDGLFFDDVSSKMNLIMRNRLPAHPSGQAEPQAVGRLQNLFNEGTVWKITMILDCKSCSPDRIRDISAMLGRAFFEDPFYKYIMPDERSRFKQLGWWMTCMISYGWEYGQIQVTDEPISGTAIWLKPDNPLINTLSMARMGMMGAPIRLGIRGFARMMEVSNVWEYLHEQEPSHHWYLMVLGVDPPYQGRGIGSSLMQPVLEQADKEGMPCYLETMTYGDVEFYRKRGFKMVAEGQVGDRIPYWTMRRSPR